MAKSNQGIWLIICLEEREMSLDAGGRFLAGQLVSVLIFQTERYRFKLIFNTSQTQSKKWPAIDYLSTSALQPN